MCVMVVTINFRDRLETGPTAQIDNVMMAKLWLSPPTTRRSFDGSKIRWTTLRLCLLLLDRKTVESSEAITHTSTTSETDALSSSFTLWNPSYQTEKEMNIQITITPTSPTWILSYKLGTVHAFSLPFSKVRLTAYLSEALTDIHPLVATRPAFPSQLHVQEFCLLSGHFPKLSMFLFWVQKSLDCLTMWPLWQASPYASKRWLTSWQACGDNTTLYGENSAATQTGHRLGDHNTASTCSSWQH